MSGRWRVEHDHTHLCCGRRFRTLVDRGVLALSHRQKARRRSFHKLYGRGKQFVESIQVLSRAVARAFVEARRRKQRRCEHFRARAMKRARRTGRQPRTKESRKAGEGERGVNERQTRRSRRACAEQSRAEQKGGEEKSLSLPSRLLNKIPSATRFCESLFVSSQAHVHVGRRLFLCPYRR